MNQPNRQTFTLDLFYTYKVSEALIHKMDAVKCIFLEVPKMS